MARPRLGDSDTERLHIKISADEVKAIEDWRYANRIPSKSEAVRRLVQLGLFLDAELEQAVDMASDGVRLTANHGNELHEAFQSVINRETLGMMFDRDQLWDMYSLARKHADEADETLRSLHLLLVSIYNASAALVDARSTVAAVKKLDQSIKKANSTVEKAEKQRAAEDKMYAENRYISLISYTRTPQEVDDYNSLSERAKSKYLKERISGLEKEEAEDPIAFAERYGIDSRKFWEKPEWKDLLAKRRAERGDE